MKFKKIVSLVIAVALIGTSSAAFAFNTNEQARLSNPIEGNDLAVENETASPTRIPVNEVANLAVNESLILDDGAVLTRISNDEYFSEVAKNSGISIDEAKRIDNSIEYVSANGGGYSHFNYSKTENVSSNSLCPFKATLEALIDLYIYNSNAEITNVTNIGTRRASGLFVGTWNETGTPDYKILYPDTGTFPAGKVEIRGRGYFQVDANVAANLGYNMEGFGFSLSATPQVGWTSKTLWMSGTYQCY